MTARVVMVQGTASSVGKSLLVTMLCRYYAEQGLRVAPFKSQNMALNSAVTPTGHEIGRAQYVQALAAGVVPTVNMNPILLKPEADRVAQVVLMGKPIGRFSALEYHAHKPELKRLIAGCLEELRGAHDVVVIEGAGSPVEVNLKDRDIVNMAVAELADAPVLLAADIDRGGVFAAIIGTLELLEPAERERVKAFVINKFRGDLALLEPGLDFLRARTSKPVLGVVPYLPRLAVADEDSLSIDAKAARPRPPPDVLDIVVVRLPRSSNFDDFDPLEREPGVSVRFVERAEDIAGADLAIIPGSKSTLADLIWLRRTGLADALTARAARAQPILGVCGGCQMLGVQIADPERVESDELGCEGLGLLAIRTVFRHDKRTTVTRARCATPSFLTAGAGCPSELSGYEIHMGRTERLAGARPAFVVVSRNDGAENDHDGAVSDNGAVVGTMLHGLFDNGPLTSALVAGLRSRRGLVAPAGAARMTSPQEELARLAQAVRDHLDLELLARVVGL